MLAFYFDLFPIELKGTDVQFKKVRICSDSAKVQSESNRVKLNALDLPSSTATIQPERKHAQLKRAESR